MLGILVLTILSIIIFRYLKKNNSNARYKAKLAPRVPGAWPFISHLPILATSETPHIALARLADKHGPIFTLDLGQHSLLVVSSSGLAKEIFTMNDLNVTFRPSIVAAEVMGYNYALFPFTPGGPYWSKMRKLSTLELLSSRRLGQLKHIRTEEVETSIRELYRMSGRGSIDMKRWLSGLNMNVLLRMVVGKKFSGENRVENENGFQQGVTTLFRFLGLTVLRDVVPSLGWIDWGGHEKIMKKTAKEIDGFLEKWLEEHKNKKEQKNGKDFMDVVISYLNGQDIESHDADTATKASCLGLITGYETVAAALTWTISLLLNNKHAMKKAQEELNTHVGKQRMVNDADIAKLVYLQAIVKESLRLYPPSFIPGPRIFIEDCTIGGYHIPKGTWLMMNLWRIHRDPIVWSDPMEFKPERFLTTYKEVDVRGLHFELLPFGAGRRECPAKGYGIQMMQFTLASLLQAFDISSVNDEPIDMTTGIGLTNMKVTDLEIIASPRLPSHCFEWKLYYKRKL